MAQALFNIYSKSIDKTDQLFHSVLYELTHKLTRESNFVVFVIFFRSEENITAYVTMTIL